MNMMHSMEESTFLDEWGWLNEPTVGVEDCGTDGAGASRGCILPYTRNGKSDEGKTRRKMV